MPDYSNLPDLEQAAADFRAEFVKQLATKKNSNPSVTIDKAVRSPVAGWHNFIDGAIARLQTYVDERIIQGVLNLGAGGRALYYVTSGPESVQAAEPGSVALKSDGTFWRKSENSDATGWVEVGAGGGDGAVTIFDVNLAAESSQDLQAGGDSDAYTVGGITWGAQSMANADEFAIQNGTGLVMGAPAGTSVNIDGASNDAPRAGPITSTALLGGKGSKGYGGVWEVWARVTSFSLPEASNYFFIGLIGESGTGYSGMAAGVGVRNWSGTIRPIMQSGSLPDPGITALPTPVSGTHDVYLLRFGPDLVQTFYGEWDDANDDWPDMGALTPIMHETAPGPSSTQILQRSGARAIAAICTASTSGAPSATVERMRMRIA